MKNQIFLVFDSLRWDIFEEAKAPFLKSLGQWKIAFTPGTYTFPAHISFFVGKLPQTFDVTDYYDTAAIRFGWDGKAFRRKQFWRLANPEAPRSSYYTLDGRNIVEGFSKQGYLTIGTGAVNWFNSELPAGQYLTAPFEKFRFFDGPNQASHKSSEEQIEWVLDYLSNVNRPYFLFINFGETHHRFVYKGCPLEEDKNPYGDGEKCKLRQRLCLEYLDKQVEKLLKNLRYYDLVACSDHGEAIGENGLWGHSFTHRKVLEVPLLIRAW